jgi:PAS domain S-box-containing protein
MLRSLRTFAQMTTYLGAGAIVAVWCGALYLAHEERRNALEDGSRQGSNLVRIFEEYISRVVGGADTTLLALRELYQHDPQHFDIVRTAGRAVSQDNSVVQFGFISPDGYFTRGTQPSNSPSNVKDRDYFRVQAQSNTDELYIGVPVIGHLSGRTIFVLARRLTAADGSFGGLVVATIDIIRLEKFYNSIDIGRGGSISLIGFDGVIRARGGRDPSAHQFVGRSVANRKPLSLVPQSPRGQYWNFDNSQPLDGVRRLISYQAVEGFPLIATVGLAESDMFEQWRSTARIYYLIASLLTAGVIGAMVAGARRQGKLSTTLAALERSKHSLEQLNLWFNTALENMAHGLSMFDKGERLILCNERYNEIYGLARDQTMPGKTLRSILEARLKLGNSPEDIDAHIDERLSPVRKSQPSYAENKLHDGRVVAVNYRPMRDGGWVAVHQEITERKRAEKHQELLISELDHRVKNVLARVAVVAKHTRRGSRSMDDLVRALDGRIQSMADAHTLLSQSHWQGVGLADLVHRQLAPYATKTNTEVEGPDITLSAAATQAVAMVLQELATNAVKYGSLSSAHGRVSVRWRCRANVDRTTSLVIAWREIGGPPTTAPNRSSYGTNLIRNLIPHELGGAVDLIFASDGVRCDIEFPLETHDTLVVVG